MGIKYYESRLNLNWKPILKNIIADPEDFIANGGWDFLDMEGGDSEDEDGSEESEAYQPSDEDESDDDSGDDDSDEDASVVDSDEVSVHLHSPKPLLSPLNLCLPAEQVFCCACFQTAVFSLSLGTGCPCHAQRHPPRASERVIFPFQLQWLAILFL